jgi:hypothetical protein
MQTRCLKPAVILLLALVGGCSPRPTKLKIVNHSDHTLKNLRISSEHIDMKMGSIPPKTTVQMSTVIEKGGRADLYFEAAGKEYNPSGLPGFTLGSWREITLTVAPDLTFVLQ